MELPKEIPLFSINRCILVPGCNIPLHVFEPKYTQMIDMLDDATPFVGLIQPKKNLTSQGFYNIGTIGELVDCKVLPKNRYFVVLKGIRRFSLEGVEKDDSVKFKKGKVTYTNYNLDPSKVDVPLDRTYFISLLERYIRLKKIKINFKEFKKIRNFEIINILSQVLPFGAAEKQSLLESQTHDDRMEQLIAVLNMELSSARISSQSSTRSVMFN